MKNAMHILERQLKVINVGNDYRLKSIELQLQFAQQTVELLKLRLRSTEHLLREGVLVRDVEEEKDKDYENGDMIVQSSFSSKSKCENGNNP